VNAGPARLPSDDPTIATPRRRGGSGGGDAYEEDEVADVKTYIYLGVAIVAEVIATSALKASDGFSRLGPSVLTATGYCAAFFFLSLVLRTMPTGIVYAIWSGFGIVLISAVSWVWSKQTLDAPAITGLGLIILGVVIVNVFSNSIRH
jgi:small multidrug resistance pump